jgi:hypothetical protein
MANVAVSFVPRASPRASEASQGAARPAVVRKTAQLTTSDAVSRSFWVVTDCSATSLKQANRSAAKRDSAESKPRRRLRTKTASSEASSASHCHAEANVSACAKTNAKRMSISAFGW